ncbi:MAG: translation initiation factor IF-2 [Alphaproteobacteria bacterium]
MILEFEHDDNNVEDENEEKVQKKEVLTLSKKAQQKILQKDQLKQHKSGSRTISVEIKTKKHSKIIDSQESKDLETYLENEPRKLTDDEFENRLKALKKALKEKDGKEEKKQPRQTKKIFVYEDVQRESITKESKKTLEQTKKEKKTEQTSTSPIVLKSTSYDTPTLSKNNKKATFPDPENKSKEKEEGALNKRKVLRVNKKTSQEKYSVESSGKLNRYVLTRVLDDNFEEHQRSIASLKRAQSKQKLKKDISNEETQIVREVIIPEALTVAELANRMAIRSSEVIKELIKLGIMATINQTIDADTAELICTEFGHKSKRILDSDVEIGLHEAYDNPEDIKPRAPIVTVMGHVDHGKTSLLDALRKTDVVTKEVGGITQHIGAYQVTLPLDKKITFIDTPGHAAFSAMRTRGAEVTDIVILVVAADDGVKEQTIEAISHAKAAKVPFIVAVNKIDSAEANPQKVCQELLKHDVVVEEYGGDVICVEVSAKQKKNLDKLEEAVLIQAEFLDLKANPTCPARGVVIEAKMDIGRGSVATVLVQNGKLKTGDIFVAGTKWGRVRILINDHGECINEAYPSVPVEVTGWSGIPEAGDVFYVVSDEAKAREIAEYRTNRYRDQTISVVGSSMEDMMSQISSGKAKELPVVIKADVHGSLEAIRSSILKLSNEKISVKVLHGGVGGINESDITLAQASSSIVIGFNVRANAQARELARTSGIKIHYHSIIYNVLDDMQKIMKGLYAPEQREKYLGRAEIRTVFNVKKIGRIAGCFVIDGIIKRNAKVRVIRDDIVIFEDDIKALKRFKDEVKEVKESYECGITFNKHDDIHEKDIIECFEIEMVQAS